MTKFCMRYSNCTWLIQCGVDYFGILGVYLFIYLFIHLFIYLFIYLFIHRGTKLMENKQ